METDFILSLYLVCSAGARIIYIDGKKAESHGAESIEWKLSARRTSEKRTGRSSLRATTPASSRREKKGKDQQQLCWKREHIYWTENKARHHLVARSYPQTDGREVRARASKDYTFIECRILHNKRVDETLL